MIYIRWPLLPLSLVTSHKLQHMLRVLSAVVSLLSLSLTLSLLCVIDICKNVISSSTVLPHNIISGPDQMLKTFC